MARRASAVLGGQRIRPPSRRVHRRQAPAVRGSRSDHDRQARPGLRAVARRRDRDRRAGRRDHVGAPERGLAKGILMTRLTNLGAIAVAVSCAGAPRPFPLRAPLAVDSDTRPVSVACRPEPSTKEPARVRCAPAGFASPFTWDYADNLVFAPMSRALAIEVSGEAANATSLDE